jgi:hypothetical protein
MVSQRDRKILAVDYLQQAVAAVQAGEFDALLTKALEALHARFQPELEKRQTLEQELDFDKTESSLLLVSNAA